MKRRNGESEQGYILNSTIVGRGEEYPVFNLSGDGIVPYMDGYIIIPKEVDELQKVELIDNAFEVAYRKGWSGIDLQPYQSPSLFRRIVSAVKWAWNPRRKQ